MHASEGKVQQYDIPRYEAASRERTVCEGSGGWVQTLPPPPIPASAVIQCGRAAEERVAMDTRWILPGTAAEILDKIDALGFPDTTAKSCRAIMPIIHHLVRGKEEASHRVHCTYNL
jgi:hypothetical protein